MRIIPVVLGVIFLSLGIWQLTLQPTNDRNWSPDQSVLSRATFDGDLVHVENVRNISYANDSAPARYNRTYDLRAANSVDFIVEPFSLWRGIAHTMLTFGFDDGTHLAISVESRNPVNASWSPWLGALKQYELIYTVADESDAVRLRTSVRNDTVYLYPVNTTRPKIRALLVSMLERANKLAGHPEFYDTFTNTCTTNVALHVNAISPGRIPPSWQIFFPGYSDKLAEQLGLLQTNLPIDLARQKFYITDLGQHCPTDADFSVCIRSRR